MRRTAQSVLCGTILALADGTAAAWTPGGEYAAGGTTSTNTVFNPFLGNLLPLNRNISVVGAIHSNDIAIFTDLSGRFVRGTNVYDQIRAWGIEGAVIGMTNVAEEAQANLAAHASLTDNPHAVTAAQIGAITSETDPAAGPRLALIEAETNRWRTAYGWGDHALAGYLGASAWQSWLGTNTYVKKEQDLVAMDALATQRVERVHDSAQPSRYFMGIENGTGTVYEVTGPFTNLTVTLSADFEETLTHTRPSWTTNVFPFTDGDWSSGTDSYSEFGLSYIISFLENTATWSSIGVMTLPTILVANAGSSQGTATVSVASIYYTTNAVDSFATEAQFTEATGQVSRATDAKLIALNPSVATVYGDLARTNTAGFAAFATTNAAQVYLPMAPSLGYETNTAWFSYSVTGLVSEAKAVTYAGNMLDTNRSGSATLWYFNAAGVAVASNTAALPSGTRSNDPMPWFTNTLSFLDYDFQFVTNGTIRLSVTLGNAGQFLPTLLYAGVATPLTLELLSAPLAYVPYTKFGGKVDAVGGAAADLQITGARVKGTLDLNGVTRTNWPDTVSGTVLTQSTSHVMAQYYDDAGYVTQQILRVGIEIMTNRWGPRVTLPDGIVTNGMGGMLLATNAAGARYVRMTGDGGGWGSALEIDGNLWLSNWGASKIRFPGGGSVSEGVFYSGGGEMGFKAWLNDAERWVIRSLDGHAYIDNGNLTVAGTNTAAVFVETGTPSWIVLTNIASACTLTNDNLRPARIFAAAGAETSTTGAVSFANLRADAAPVYFTVQGFRELRFPTAYVVGGGSWQTNRVNIFTAWLDGTNTFVSPITTREIY